MKTMKMKRLLAPLLCVFLLLSLCACGGTGGGQSNPLAEHAGYYLAVEIDGGENSTSREDMEMIQQLGMYVTLTLNEDGTGEMSLFGTAFDLTWDNEGFSAGDEGTGKFTFNGNELRASEPESSETIIFEKVDALPEAANAG